MIVEVGLILLLAGVLAFHGWTERRHAADRNRLLNALMARNAGEYAGLNVADDRPKPKPRDRDLEPQVGS